MPIFLGEVMKLCRVLMIGAVLLTGYSFVLLAMMAPWVLAAITVVLVGLAAKKGYILTAFGTARWANQHDVRKAGMLDGQGLIVGRLGAEKSLKGFFTLFDPRVDSAVACRQFLAMWKPENPLVRLNKAVHTAVFAPTGVGKGVSCVIPHLLTCPDSCIVVDFKGENSRLTADHRRKAFGHKIVMLDPFKVVTQSPSGFNPLDFISKESSVAMDECRDLAAALVVRTGQEKEPHWADSAELWITAMKPTPTIPMRIIDVTPVYIVVCGISCFPCFPPFWPVFPRFPAILCAILCACGIVKTPRFSDNSIDPGHLGDGLAACRME